MRSPLLLLGLSVLTAGCGRQVATVSGKVTLDGKPLANARVNFQPSSGDAVNPGVGSYGQTDANGEYSLNLIDGTGPGAVVGTHRVMIRAVGGGQAAAPGKDPEKASPDRVPLRYNLQST